MLPVEVCRIAGDQQFDLLPSRIYALQHRIDNRKRMLLKRSPGKTEFEQERSEDQVDGAMGARNANRKNGRAKIAVVSNQNTTPANRWNRSGNRPVFPTSR